WNITEFAEQMQGLVSGNIQFRTIPVGDPTDTWSDGNVLPVNPAQVRQFIKSLATDPATSSTAPTTTPSGPPPSSITVQVFNSSGSPGRAITVLEALVQKGFLRGAAEPGGYLATTEVRYGAGQKAAADRVISALDGNATAVEDDSVPRGQVHVYVGADYSGTLPSDEPEQAAVGGAPTATTTTPPITADGVVCVN
ncbi:MAG: LytR C-terminal domain-containing protein, partial [Saccharothrix sp.]|nr:LytR C-terminal domain-containing protein [Saccharothrix sp.]